MTDALVARPGTSATVVVRLTSSEGTVDIQNNRSYLYVDGYLGVTAANGAGGPYKLSPASSAALYASGNLSGQIGSWSAGYDLRPASSLPFLHLIHWEGWVAHNADGSASVNLQFDFSGAGGTPLGFGSVSHTQGLSTIPRNRTIVGSGGTWKTGEVYVDINGERKMGQPYVGKDGAWVLLNGTP